MTFKTQSTEGIYRHENGLKHINIINNEGYSALFVVNTPVVDDSGIAHAVEHMVFRRSKAFPQPETLFQLTSLTDAKINASTFADTTYFHCQSQCYHTFKLVLKYLLNGLFAPAFNNEDLQYEIHNGDNKGVVYQELLGIENNDTQTNNKNEQAEFRYGGISGLIGELSLKDLKNYHQKYYQTQNITLVTSNLNVEKASHLISLLPKHNHQSDTEKTLDKSYRKTQSVESNNTNKKKYSSAINKLITIYKIWLQDPYYQEIDDYTEIINTQKPLLGDTDISVIFTRSRLISSLAYLSNVLSEKAISTESINAIIKNKNSIPFENKVELPGLFTELFQIAKSQLSNDRSYSYVSDKRNALWVKPINNTDKVLASICSYIISAYPSFLTHRCQGSCYATQALAVNNAEYLVIYSAFDLNPKERLDDIPNCVYELSQDSSFLSLSLSLAKNKYCLVNQAHSSKVIDITTADVANYLLAIADSSHPKV